MKRLNPLYVILLFLTILFISFFVLDEKSKQFTEKSKEYENIQLKTKKYKELKSKWNNEDYVTNTVNKIIKNRKFSNEKILVAKVNKVVKEKIESINQKLLDDFLNRFLNKSLIIKNMNITKTSVTLELGIK